MRKVPIQQMLISLQEKGPGTTCWVKNLQLRHTSDAAVRQEAIHRLSHDVSDDVRGCVIHTTRPPNLGFVLDDGAVTRRQTNDLLTAGVYYGDYSTVPGGN